MTRTDRARLAQAIAVGVMASAAAVAIGVAVVFLGLIVARGAGGISWEFLTQPPRRGMHEGGILPAIAGTLLLTTGTAALMLPVGVLGGIYLAEYAPRSSATRMIRLAIANMAGVPSIVYGLFGLAVFVLAARLDVSVLAGSLTLACLSLPVVITATEEAIRQVPSDLRQASLALGAGRWRTIHRVVLPAAAPGIVTGGVLALSRAAGETAPIIFTAAAFSLRRLPDSLSSPVMAMPYHIYVLATQVPDRPDRIVWATALVLVLGVSAVNVSAALWRSARRRKVRW